MTEGRVPKIKQNSITLNYTVLCSSAVASNGEARFLEVGGASVRILICISNVRLLFFFAVMASKVETLASCLPRLNVQPG